jgi:hypothetical protein
MGQQLSTNTFGVAKWVVSPDATQGTHTTIASAIASASSGDTIYLRDGTYTENLTLKAGVNICSFASSAFGPSSSQVTIIGNLTFSVAGSINISGVAIQTNGSYAITMAGSGASSLRFIQCGIIASNNTAILYSTSNSSAALSFTDCLFIISDTFAAYSMTSTGNLNLSKCFIGSTSSLVYSNSAGLVSIYNSVIGGGIQSTGAGGVNVVNSDIVVSGTTIALDFQGTGTASVNVSSINSGTGACINIGAGVSCQASTCELNTSAANSITGSGKLYYSGLNLTNLAPITGVTLNGQATLSGAISFDGGINLLNHFVDWTAWTPTLVGNITAGTTTYVTQLGQYCRIGNMVTVAFRIEISATTGTGSVLIKGLPIPISTSYIHPLGSLALSGVTFPVSCSQVNLTVDPTLAAITMVGSGTGVIPAYVQMANAAQTFWGTITYRC